MKLKPIKLSGLSAQKTQKIIPNNTILLGYVGSIAHGTYVPSSNKDSIDDKDIMGISIGNPNVYLGLQKFEHKITMYKEWDSTIYEIKKFFRLILKQNPNVMSLLWLQDKDYIYKSSHGIEILNNKDLFISKKIYKSFIGYAKSQDHKMTHGAQLGYMGKKRKELVVKYGYDCKNASHMIRLLRMCIEYLTDGEFQVFRKDAKELKDIKSGGWSLKQVKEEAKRLFILSEEAYVRSPLPMEPNYEKAEKLLMNIIKDYI